MFTDHDAAKAAKYIDSLADMNEKDANSCEKDQPSLAFVRRYIASAQRIVAKDLRGEPITTIGR